MAHQTHSIPWTTVASNFDFIKWQGSRLFAPLGKPNQAKELKYATVAFARAIEEFSATERRKLGSEKEEENDADGEKLSTEVVERLQALVKDLVHNGIYSGGWAGHPDILDMVHDPPVSLVGEKPVINISQLNNLSKSELADLICFMLMLESPLSIQTLGRIARSSPQTILRLWSWEDKWHYWGLKKLMERTVDFYVGANVLYSKVEFWTQKGGNADYRKTAVYRAMLSYRAMWDPLGSPREGGALYPGEAWAAVHRWFWGVDAVFDEVPSVDGVDLGRDGDKLREYLKTCWNILVGLDVLVREAGGEIDWAQVMAGSIAHWFSPWKGVGKDLYEWVSENETRKFDYLRLHCRAEFL